MVPSFMVLSDSIHIFHSRYVPSRDIVVEARRPEHAHHAAQWPYVSQQRRSRHGLLHQGSVQFLEPPAQLSSELAGQLAEEVTRHPDLTEAEIKRAHELVSENYGTDAWLQRR